MIANRIDSLFDKRVLTLGAEPPAHLELVERKCDVCRRRLAKRKRRDARTCSKRCRQAAYRKARRAGEPSLDVSSSSPSQRRLLSAAARARTGLDSGSVPTHVPTSGTSKRVLSVRVIRRSVEVRID